MPKEQEIALLESQAKWLEQTLEQIRKRLEELHDDRKELEETIEKEEAK